jgi:molybdopterin synthase sulfur carrier subunit
MASPAAPEAETHGRGTRTCRGPRARVAAAVGTVESGLKWSTIRVPWDPSLPGGPVAVAVDVRLPTLLRAQAGGQSTVTVKADTIGDVLRELVSEFPGMSGQLLNEDGSLHRFVNVYVNDDDVRYLESLETPVKEGDEVSLLPAVAGG